MVRSCWLVCALLVGCRLPPSSRTEWVVAIDHQRSGPQVLPTLLGHYDLSGALWQYPRVPGLVNAMRPLGFAEWRVSVERWEGRSQLFSTLPDGTACSYPVPQAFFSGSDVDLMRARDWFIDDGQPVTAAATADDRRYALGYVRSVLDVAYVFGARPFVSIDAMPRALSMRRDPMRVDCLWSFRNGVTNAPPADAAVYAQAVVGMVHRIVDGSGGEPGRPVTHFEIGNEPDVTVFWDSSLDPDLSRYFATARETLTRLDAFRKSSGHSELRFGLGGFGHADTAIAAIARLDADAVPLDFISFHAYDTNPAAIGAQIDRVIAAARASAHYKNVQVALTEWGPGFDIENNDESRLHPNVAWAQSMAPALHAATVIAHAANAGLARAHHVFFWDFHAFRIRGLLDHDLQPRVIERAWELLVRTIGNGGRTLTVPPIAGAEVVAVQQTSGPIRVLIVNPGATAHHARVELDGSLATPKRVSVFDDPKAAVHDIAATPLVTIPAQSIVVLEL